MNRWLTPLVATFALCRGVRAAEPCCHWWQTLCHPLSQPRPCCPDDYCLKPLPHAPCPVCNRGPDDYCSKPLAISHPLKYASVDDYCPKKCPILLPPCYPPWYTCGALPGCGLLQNK